MSIGHNALILEDHEDTAKRIIAAVRARGDHAFWAKTREEAVAILGQQSICYIIGDIEVPNAEGDIPNEVAGMSFMKFDVYANHRGRTDLGKLRLQFIAVTGFSDDYEFFELLMQEGASAFIKKPLPNNLAIAAKISEALRHSERFDHANCEGITRLARQGSTPPAALVAKTVRGAAERPRKEAKIAARVKIAVPGTQRKAHSLVIVNGHECTLQNAYFRLLLRLIVANAKAPGAWTHRNELGGRGTAPWELPPRLDKELRAQAELVKGVALIENDRSGSYRLSPQVAIEHLDLRVLARHSDEVVQRLAGELSARNSDNRKGASA